MFASPCSLGRLPLPTPKAWTVPRRVCSLSGEEHHRRNVPYIVQAVIKVQLSFAPAAKLIVAPCQIP